MKLSQCSGEVKSAGTRLPQATLLFDRLGTEYNLKGRKLKNCNLFHGRKESCPPTLTLGSKERQPQVV